MKIFENRRVKGAVSIFLVIITIPAMLLSAVLIDGSRMASARAMTQEGTDLAAASVLASYNQTLKDQYGLFALNETDPEKLKAVFEESLNATLLAGGMDLDSTYSERMWDIMKTTLTGNKSYMGESFLNLYDFKLEKCTVEPLYALANQDVLENQMVEYAKFRGLYVMMDRMDIFSNLGDMKKEAEKNQTTAQVMEDKMDADEANAKADRELAELRNQIETLNTDIGTVKTAENSYIAALKAKMEEIRIENTDTEDELSTSQSRAADDYEKSQKDLKKAAEKACKQAGAVLKQAKKTKREVETAIGRLESFQSKNQGKATGNESVGSLITDAEGNIKDYRTDYLPEIQNLIDDSILNQMDKDSRIKSSLDDVMEDIDEAINKYIEVIDEIRNQSSSEDEEDGENGEAEEEEEITEYYYYYLNSSESTTEADSAISGRGVSYSYKPAVNNINAYFIDKEWDTEKVNPSKKYKNTSSEIMKEEFAKEQSGKSGNSDTNLEGEAERGKVEDSVFNVRPSKTWAPDKEKNNNTDFYNKEGDLTSSKNILNQGKHSMILDIAETARDDILCFTYMFGTFKTRLTGVKKFSSEGMSSKDKDSFYMPKWRYAHPEGELDMRFAPKKDRNTVLRSEIEYLIYGNKSDAANEAAVYATIFAERLANNLVVMYGEKSIINPSCHAAAAAACAATLGLVPEPVFFWIFLTAWATAETFIEMDYLISGGYKIPLLKTTKNILLDDLPDGKGLIENYGQTGLFVSYEDYLLLLLLIKGRDKRIMRTADLIEMNMKNNGESDFTMAEAYTWIHGDTELSIRYLFGTVQPFRETYEKEDYTGRLYFTNTIYQGY